MTAFTPLDLMERHVVTLFRHDTAGRLLAVNEPGDPSAPRFFLGRTLTVDLCRVRHDVPDDVAAGLARVLAHEPPLNDPRQLPVTLPQLRAMLEAQAPVTQQWHGPAWHFPDEIVLPNGMAPMLVTDAAALQSTFPGWAATLSDNLPCVAAFVDGVAVALCASARTSALAAEAGVDTLAAYRGRGYATAVVAAWARAVRATGREPLYSTSWDNLASRGVARRLGLIMYGADLHIT